MSGTQIPAAHDSEYEGRPFLTCTRCGEMLAEIPQGHQVVKYWHNREVVYEFAVCHPCHASVLGEFSEESLDRLRTFHAERFRLNLGRGACAVCCRSAAELPEDEFSLTGLFSGNTLQHETLICGACTREMEALMSEKTRGVWERFVEHHFPTAPADVLTTPGTLLTTH
ncbi:MAG: hypothetical protein KA004_18590 [Verrucomicrobiales bacterium]|nr:hypothetical protein [Verrucomicrobiales bacterium]